MDPARVRASLRLRALDIGDRLKGRHDALVPLRHEDESFTDERIFERLREHGLVLTDLHPGSWSGREEHMHFQDVLVAVRDGA